MRRKRLTFWIDEEQSQALKNLKERDGVPESEQIRRALTAWFDAKGVSAKAVKPTKKRGN